MHLMLHCADSLDWQRLLARFDRYWPLLLTYLTLFTFVYPSERHKIPSTVMEDLLERQHQALTSRQAGDKVCQGTLTSRAQYMIDIGQYGFADARLTPRGDMTPEDVIYWTWAIENID
jgi:hypothetical protein